MKKSSTSGEIPQTIMRILKTTNLQLDKLDIKKTWYNSFLLGYQYTGTEETITCPANDDLRINLFNFICAESSRQRRTERAPRTPIGVCLACKCKLQIVRVTFCPFPVTIYPHLGLIFVSLSALVAFAVGTVLSANSGACLEKICCSYFVFLANFLRSSQTFHKNFYGHSYTYSVISYASMKLNTDLFVNFPKDFHRTSTRIIKVL